MIRVMRFFSIIKKINFFSYYRGPILHHARFFIFFNYDLSLEKIHFHNVKRTIFSFLSISAMLIVESFLIFAENPEMLSILLQKREKDRTQNKSVFRFYSKARTVPCIVKFFCSFSLLENLPIRNDSRSSKKAENAFFRYGALHAFF